MDEHELMQIIRRFKNYCYVNGWPSKSFQIRVYNLLKEYDKKYKVL